MRRACTIIARNYWAHVRVLVRSLKDHHPDVAVSVLVIDGDDETKRAGEREPFEVLCPADVGLARREIHRMASIYDLLELATAVKPWLLRHLLDMGATSVVYLDPDIEVFNSLDELWATAERDGIVVTPHTTVPTARDEAGATEELTILGSGAYNLGFIAVGSQSRPFLDWWADRLRRDGLIAKDAAMFVDQRWIDLVPSYFDVHILRGDGWNVAYWNLPARNLTRVGPDVLVNDEPLRFFHFSGYSPERPGELSCYESDPPRTRLDEHPVLAELCLAYGRKLLLNGHRAHKRIPYGFARSARGLPLDRYARRLYRRELMEAERTGRREPPDPFDRREARAFEDWLRAPAAAHRVTRYLKGLWEERADLRASFRDLSTPDARFYVDWARTRARFEPNVAAELVALETHRRPVMKTPGVNVAGYLKAESGVGEVSRLLVTALDSAGIPLSIVPFTKTSSRQQAVTLDDRFGAPEYDTNIVCVNADALPGFVEDTGETLMKGRRTIAVWQWEIEQFPDWMARSADWVDEIWVASEHAAFGVRERTDRPVFVFPPPVVSRSSGRTARSDLDLPDGFLFLFCFDFDSVFERKNPIGVIEAFSHAFAPGSGPQLLIKSVRGETHPAELERLLAVASTRPDVHVRDGYLSPGDQAALMASCDAYVSLHRSEGFGLTMAEAMAMGKPVVATAYSGNLEFMDVTNSWLVPYELTPIPDGCEPYPAGARWASPDADAAAEMMHEIVGDPTEASVRGRHAAEDIARLHSPHCREPFLRERLRHVPDPPEIKRARAKEKEGRGERPWLAVESAHKEVTTGPDVTSPTSYGFVSRLVRRLVLRVARHYIEHQEKIQSSLLSSVEDLEARSRAEAEAARTLEREVRELRERLDDEEELRRKLEAQPGAQGSRPSHDQTPGREQRMRSYAGLFGTHAPVLAVGREAEDHIDVLATHGVNVFTLQSAAGSGALDIATVLDGMASLADRSLGGIFTAHVIDRLSVDDLQRFLELSRRKLAAGGVLVAETEDHRSAAGAAVGQRGAMAPRTLLELCRSTGFEQAYVLFASGASSAEYDEPAEGEYAIVASVLVPGRG